MDLRTFGAIFVLLVAEHGSGAINLELRPAASAAGIGDGVFALGLYAVSDDDTNQLLSALQAIITWDPAHLQLVALDGTGAVPLQSSSFPADPFGLNEVSPPQDGDGIYVAFAPLAGAVTATPSGVLVTSFIFQPLLPTPATAVDILDIAGTPTTETRVFDAEQPNLVVTGTLSGAVIEVLPCCPADLDGDCLVAVTDMLTLLGLWGTDPGGPPDLDGDGVVGTGDFLELLQSWGPCP